MRAHKNILLCEELGNMLGFDGAIAFKANGYYESPHTAKITSVNVISVECNLATGAYLNGKPTHSIHEFTPEVAPGFKVISIPHTVIYYPINSSSLDFLSVELKDQNGRTVDLRGEVLTVRVHLKRLQ